MTKELPGGKNLQTEIRKYIFSLIDRIPIGGCLPTEKELCARFHVSRATVQIVTAALKREGFIEKSRGRGTFVLSKDKRIFTNSGASFKGSILFVYPDYPSLEFMLFRQLAESRALDAQLNLLELRVPRYAPFEEMLEKMFVEENQIKGVLLWRELFCPENSIKRFAQNVPWIFFNVPASFGTVLVPDYENAQSLLMHYVFQNTSGKIVFIYNEPVSGNRTSLIRILRNCAREMKYPARNFLIKQCALNHWEDSLAAAYRATGEVMAEYPDCQKLLYLSYSGAVAGIRKLHEMGIAVPEQVGVMAFSSPLPPFSDYLTPRIAHMSCSREDCINMALNEIFTDSGLQKKTLSVKIRFYPDESLPTTEKTFYE